MKKKNAGMRVLGIMSGTSIDSVDYALCRVLSRQIQLLAHWSERFPAALHERLHRAARGEAGCSEVARLHHDLGRFFARHAAKCRPRPDLVGLHGQTVFHAPGGRRPATLQLGEAAYLAETLRVPVVSNFRAADLAAGGQAAPLATMFHLQVFGRRHQHICVNNLGGISNVTSIDWRSGSTPRVTAFDTGPANVLLDLAMRQLTDGRLGMDRGGRWSARGRGNEQLLQRWLQHPYFRRQPPKSTGREQFGETFWEQALPQMRRAGLSPCDMLATLTEFTARSLALNYRLHLVSRPEVVVLTGGGAANRVLAEAIDHALRTLNPSIQVTTSDALGWPLQTIEPSAFALLAWKRWRGEAGNLPTTTGARRAVCLGQVSSP